jgi:hypothetical protein
MGVNIYRNESLIQVDSYEAASEQAPELVAMIRQRWALMREKGLVGDYPVEILQTGSTPTRVLQVFKWQSTSSPEEAQQDADYRQLESAIAQLSTTQPAADRYTEVIRGFNSNFPKSGGVELLKGVCSCLLTIDNMIDGFPLSVKNGIVLMHRSPGADMDGDGRPEMYLKILMHGGETVQGNLGPIRVEQNFSRPNDGLVKSNGSSGSDFPGTAVWRVSWRIQTALGPILTDPDNPLIFGPATVNHYPPVGTHFHSSTGPVKLLLEETGVQVGTLVPGELTAFDIVVTKDDEIYADILNTPPADIFEILAKEVASASNGAIAEERDVREVTLMAPGAHD